MKTTRILSLFLIIATLLCTLPAGIVTAETGETADAAVHYVTDNELMNGTAIGVFAPSVSVNRAMIVTVLYRMEGSPDVNEMKNPFTDVKSGRWYTETRVRCRTGQRTQSYGQILYRL